MERHKRLERKTPLRPKVPVDRERAKQLYEDGRSIFEIGRELGCSGSAVARSLKRSGVQARPAGGPIDSGEIVRRYEASEGYAKIARSMGVSRDRVRRTLIEAGVDTTRLTKPPPKRRRSGRPGYDYEFERMTPVVKERSGGLCEARFSAGCTGRGEHVHHRKLRSQGGANTEENLIDVCRSCHTSIHVNPAKSYAAGLLVHSWEDPATRPFQGPGTGCNVVTPMTTTAQATRAGKTDDWSEAERLRDELKEIRKNEATVSGQFDRVVGRLRKAGNSGYVIAKELGMERPTIARVFKRSEAATAKRRAK